MRLFCCMAFVLSFLATPILAGDKSKTPHTKIIVRPGPPVKPTQPAKPVGNQKSDWGEKKS